MNARSPQRFALLAVLPLLAVCCGCPVGVPPDGAPADSAFPFLDQDGNFSFDAATALALDATAATSTLEFSGRISNSGDLDLYSLGRLEAGDALIADVQRTSGDLDAVAAVFDERELLLAFNDDRVPDASDLNPRLDVIILGPTGEYFLGIAPLAGSGSTGDYRVSVQIIRGVGVPAATGQVVFLDWNGGTDLLVENVGTFDLTPFDAGDLGLSSQSTESFKDRVQQIVLDRYTGFNLTLRNSDDDGEPREAHTTIYFGGNSRRAFAISEKIDTLNADPSDTGIVFTRAYRLAFEPTPSFEQMAQAVGNTVAHEIGHLLGLVHTADCDSLMDTTCGNNRLLSPQEFTTAPLDESVFPVGSQNALEILGWLLGFAM